MSLDVVPRIHDKLKNGQRITKNDARILCKHGVVLHDADNSVVIHSDNHYVYVSFHNNRVRKSEYISVDYDNTTSSYITFSTSDGKLVTARII